MTNIDADLSQAAGEARRQALDRYGACGRVLWIWLGSRPFQSSSKGLSCRYKLKSPPDMSVRWAPKPGTWHGGILRLSLVYPYLDLWWFNLRKRYFKRSSGWCKIANIMRCVRV